MSYLLAMLVFGLIAFWLTQLVSLMRMSDDQFSGRHDKLIWALILLLLPILGAFIFLGWKWSVQADEESNAVASQMSDLIKRSDKMS